MSSELSQLKNQEPLYPMLSWNNVDKDRGSRHTHKKVQRQEYNRSASEGLGSSTSLAVPPGSGSGSGGSNPSHHLHSIEKSSSFLLSELKRKPQKERALREALELQDRLVQLESTLESNEADTTKRRQALQEQLLELDRKKEETMRDMENLSVELEQSQRETRKMIESLRSQPDYKERSSIDRLSREIEQLNFHANKVRTVISLSSAPSSSSSGGGSPGSNGQDNDDCFEPELLCPVCLSIPDDQIYTCVQCDNMLCGSCRGQVASCPTCRKNFKNHAPRRNRLAERLIATRK